MGKGGKNNPYWCSTVRVPWCRVTGDERQIERQRFIFLLSHTKWSSTKWYTRYSDGRERHHTLRDDQRLAEDRGRRSAVKTEGEIGEWQGSTWRTGQPVYISAFGCFSADIDALSRVIGDRGERRVWLGYGGSFYFKTLPPLRFL